MSFLTPAGEEEFLGRTGSGALEAVPERAGDEAEALTFLSVEAAEAARGEKL